MEMELTQSAEPGEQFRIPEQAQSCGQLARSHDPTDCSPGEACLTPQYPHGAADMPQDLQLPQNFLLQLSARRMPKDVCTAALLVPAPGPQFSRAETPVASPGACVVAEHHSSLLLTLKPLQLHHHEPASSLQQKEEAAEGRETPTWGETSPN